MVRGRLESKKIFVGGLAPAVTDAELREYFEPYGPVKEAIVMYDRSTNRSRGFGFVTFESEEAINKVMKDKNHEIMSKFVEVKRAEPREGRADSGRHGGGPRDFSYQAMSGYGQGRYPGMYQGAGMRNYAGYGRGYPGYGAGMGYYGGGFPPYGMGGAYGGRGFYGGAYGPGPRAGMEGSGREDHAIDRRDSDDGTRPAAMDGRGVAARGAGTAGTGGYGAYAQGQAHSPAASAGAGGNGYGMRAAAGGMPVGGPMGMMGYGYGAGYGGYGVGGYGQRISQDASYNETGYGAYRGQNTAQGRTERAYRPY